MNTAKIYTKIDNFIFRKINFNIFIKRFSFILYINFEIHRIHHFPNFLYLVFLDYKILTQDKIQFYFQLNILVSCTHYVNQFDNIMKENNYSNSFIDLDTRFINYLYFVVNYVVTMSSLH